MPKIVECVPNFSDGRSGEVSDAKMRLKFHRDAKIPPHAWKILAEYLKQNNLHHIIEYICCFA